MEKRWRVLPEDCVLIIFDFLEYPYPPNIDNSARCKHYYKRQCVQIREIGGCCCEKYSVALFVFSLVLGFIMGEALSRI